MKVYIPVKNQLLGMTSSSGSKLELQIKKNFKKVTYHKDSYSAKILL